MTGQARRQFSRALLELIVTADSQVHFDQQKGFTQSTVNVPAPIPANT
jgi:hypothetical protein